MNVDILFTAWNRLAYTKASFELLRRHTNWDLVDKLVVYDDGSTDGTREHLEYAGARVGVPEFHLREGGWHSTGATMNDFVALTEAEAFVKIDNDIAMPPGWLEAVLDAAELHPEYDLIGMEAGWPDDGRATPIGEGRYCVSPARHIGGVGLMRTEAFTRRKPVPLSLGKNGRAGFTIWQHRMGANAGWITPDLPVVQLDRIPDFPWADHAAKYVEAGWARAWDPYEPSMQEWWNWIPQEVKRKARR